MFTEHFDHNFEKSFRKLGRANDLLIVFRLDMETIQWYLVNRPDGYQNLKSVTHDPAAPITGQLDNRPKCPYNRPMPL